MEKDYVVVFGKLNARLLVNPPDLPRYHSVENALVNPSLDLVKDRPPHYWKKAGERIVPMNYEERLERDRYISLGLVDNKKMSENAKSTAWKYYYKLRVNLLFGRLGFGLAAGAAITYLLK